MCAHLAPQVHADRVGVECEVLTLVGLQRFILGDHQGLVEAAECGLPELERNEALGPQGGVELVEERLAVSRQPGGVSRAD
jgi:hypothetical protein